MTKPLIAILGSGGATDEVLLLLARQAGSELARRGAVVVVGGTGGVFAAACEGAQSAGGTALVLLGDAQRPPDTGDGTTLVLATGLGAARHAVMAHACDGAIVIEGWDPTLAIVAEFTSLRKPVAAIRGTGGVADATAGQPLIPGGRTRVAEAKTPAEAVALLLPPGS